MNQPAKKKFHGYSISPVTTVIDNMPCGPTAVQLHIGTLPNRNGLCLYSAQTNKFCATVTPLAYIRTEKAATDLQAILDWMILKQPPQ